MRRVLLRPKVAVVVMLSMMRSLLYRLAKSNLMLAATLATIACSCVLAFVIWLSQQPQLGLDNIIEGDISQLTILQICGQSFVSGSFLAMVTGVFVASFIAADFKTGYIKNYLQVRGGRMSYAVASVVIAIIASIWFLLVAMVATIVTLPLVGQSYLIPSIDDIASWILQVALVISAYAVIAVLLVALTKSSTVGSIAAILLGGAAVETMMNLILSNIPGAPYALRTCMDYYLAMDLSALAAGDITGMGAFVEGGLTLIVAAILLVIAMRRRSLA